MPIILVFVFVFLSYSYPYPDTYSYYGTRIHHVLLVRPQVNEGLDVVNDEA